MRIEENYSLEKHNTFHLPVKARWFMEYTNEEELGRIFRDEYFQECLSLHIGSGSNLLRKRRTIRYCFASGLPRSGTT